MPAPKAITDLVRHFEAQKDSFRSGKYNETQLRREFLDPFFETLGWDVQNRKMRAAAYKDVIHEDTVKVGTMTKAPDYSFRVGGVRKFFVEAKKPAVNIKEDVDPSFQLRRYGWSAKLPLSILTDFEEFVIYDCRTKPKKTDSAAVGRILYLTCNEYVDRWDEIAGIFSHEAILQGSFDAFADKTKAKRGVEGVDDAFLKEIEEWRELLAKNIAIRNTELSQRELNFAVQQTIDRIVFLRICEDRGTEEYMRLFSEINGVGIYGRLKKHFHDADARYNSGLFHFNEEKDQSDAPDTLTLGLDIDDDVLKKIISRLYYPESPYEFSVLPAEILGQVYEQFLGKVIRLTEGHHAKVEEKPEVRKAGGVYYTPPYIVQYIVEQTVGKLLEGKTPKQVEKLRILDPACGSGSFLLGTYQYLLDWHLRYYLENDPKKHPKALFSFRTADGVEEWRLSTPERKRILLNNIFGVDIDAQAVEVTKLSLLLKVLEGETDQSLQGQFAGMKERALPNLGSNIKCGNSLIGPDFYATEQRGLFGDEETYRINAFDWERAFPQVFTGKDLGFDAVIGNPPYIRIQAMKEWAPVEVEYYKKRYKSASKGNYDIYVVFVERMLSLLNKEGVLGYILPHKFFNAKYGEPLREILSKGKHLQHVVHFGDQQIFKGATTYTCLMFLKKSGSNGCDFEKVNDLAVWRQRKNGAEKGKIEAKSITGKEWNFVVGSGSGLFEKLKAMPVKLGDVAGRIFQGLVTGSDPVFILEDRDNGFFSAATSKLYALENELMHPLCKGSVNLRRYYVDPPTKSILFPYKIENGKAMLLTVKELETLYPQAWKYLLENRGLLENRERGKWKNEHWYAFGRSQNLSEMEQQKILTPSIAASASFTFDETDFYYFVGSGGGGGGGYGVTLKNETGLHSKYVLALLNSHLLDSYLKTFSSSFSGGYFAYNRQYIEQLPIRAIDFSNPKDKLKHNHIVELVNKMLDLHKQLPNAKTPHEKEILQRQIEATDREIDEMVFELYGLTNEEKKIVFSSNTK